MRVRIVALIGELFRLGYMSRDPEQQAATINATATPEALFRMMLRYGVGDVYLRRMVEERLATKPELLLQVVRLAEHALLMSPPSSGPIPLKWLREYCQSRFDDRQASVYSVAVGLIERIVDIPTLKELERSRAASLCRAANSRLRELGDERAWRCYIHDLAQRREIQTIYGIALSFGVEKVPDIALTTIRQFLLADNGRLEWVESYHQYVPGAPGHGGTRAYTSCSRMTVDHTLVISRIEDELQRRASVR